MADQYPLTLHAIYTDPDDGTSSWLGDLSLSADGFLTVAAVNKDFEDELSPLVDELNGKETLTVRTPPPPDAPRFQLYGQSFERSDPDFLSGLQRYAESAFGLKLRTKEQLAAEREQAERGEAGLGEESVDVKVD